MSKQKIKNLIIASIFVLSACASSFLNLNSNTIPTPNVSASADQIEQKNTTSKSNVLPDVKIFIYAVDKIKEVVCLLPH